MLMFSRSLFMILILSFFLISCMATPPILAVKPSYVDSYPITTNAIGDTEVQYIIAQTFVDNIGSESYNVPDYTKQKLSLKREALRERHLISQKSLMSDYLLNSPAIGPEVDPCSWNSLSQRQINALILKRAMQDIGKKPADLNCKTWTQHIARVASCNKASIPLTFPNKNGWRLHDNSTILELADIDFTQAPPGSFAIMHYFKLNGKTTPHSGFVYSNTRKVICFVDNSRSKEIPEYLVDKRCYEHKVVRKRTRGRIAIYQLTNKRLKTRAKAVGNKLALNK